MGLGIGSKQKTATSLKRCKTRPRLLWRTNGKSHTRFRLVPKSMMLDDLEWPMCTLVEKLRFTELTRQIWRNRDPYYQQQKWRPLILVSGNVRYMRIFAGVPRRGGFKRLWGFRRQFSTISVATYSETLVIRSALLHRVPEKKQATLIFDITSPSVKIFLQFLKHLVQD